MPKDHLALRVVESEQLNLAIAFKWSEAVIEFPLLTLFGVFCVGIDESLIESTNAVEEAYLSHDDLLHKTIRDLLCHIQGSRLERYSFLLFAIWEHNLYLLSRHLYNQVTSLLQPVCVVMSTYLCTC